MPNRKFDAAIFFHAGSIFGWLPLHENVVTCQLGNFEVTACLAPCDAEEELDFIINYDIKYRMGDELNEE